MKNRIIKLIMGIALLAFLNACSEEDNTGFSPVKPASVTISSNASGTVGAFVETDSVFTYTLTLDKAQSVNIDVAISQIDGTATADEDFEFPSIVTIPWGKTSVSFNVEILGDDLIEGTETATLQIGDANTANASFAPTTVSFTIENFEGTDLQIDLSWSSTYDLFDDETGRFDAYDFADLRLVITNEAGAALGIADGSGAESITIPGGLADGTYFVKTDVYAFADLGSLEDDNLDLDFTTHFFQPGVMDETLGFPGAMNSAFGDCPSYIVTLVKIVKVGTTYTLTSAVEADGEC